MFVDSYTQLAAAQAFTATALFTNVLDMSTVDPDLGDGEPIGLQLTVDVAADFTTGNETYQLDILTDDAAALSSPTVVQSAIITAAELAAGDKHFFPLKKNIIQERYIGGRLTLGGTTPTITVSADIRPQSMSEGNYRHYASGFTVS